MTPFGARLRQLREDRGIRLKDMAEELGVSATYLSALEHGRRSKPNWSFIQRVIHYFNIIWDEADELSALARLSNPRVTVDTAGMAPERTALANRLAQSIGRLAPETVAALHAVLDSGAQQPKGRGRRPGQA